MPDEPAEDSVAAAGPARSTTPGDAPDRIRRRYLLERRGGDIGFYVDARIDTPAFKDRGKRLATHRADPNAIRDMVAIAHHRGWTTIKVEGAPGFRREAWLQGRLSELEVRGYRPSPRDLQLLERRREKPARERRRGPADKADREATAKATMRVVQTVVQARVEDPAARDRIVSAAQSRLDTWVARTIKAPSKAPRRERTR